MCKIVLFVAFASVVNCRGWHASHGILHAKPSVGTQQSRGMSALSTLLLSPKLARPAHTGHRPRFPAARMQVQTEERPKVETEEKATPTGPFAPLVLQARDVIGAQDLQKVRAQIIKQHSKVIADFVDTSDSEFGQSVLKRLFETADKDGNGSLDREEIREAMKSLGFVATTDKDLDKIMKKADRDDNEVIDYEEFVKAAPLVLKNQLTQLAKSNGHDLGFMVDLKGFKPEDKEAFISEELQETFTELGYLFMKLAVGAVMIHHGQEKILSAEMFTKFAIDKYFSFLPGPHIYWTYLVGYIQYLAPFFMGLGIFSRAAAASLTGVMAGALFQDLIQNGWEKFPMFELAGLSQKLKYGVPIFHNYGFEVPLLYVAIFSYIAVTGPGKFSIAQLLGWNDDKSLFGKLKQ